MFKKSNRINYQWKERRNYPKTIAKLVRTKRYRINFVRISDGRAR